MKSPVRFVLALALGFGSTAFAAPINLVTNGSFEQGTFGIGSFQGWQTSLGDMNTFVDSSGQTGSKYGQASDGIWAAYFGSTSASGGSSITQTLLTTAGAFYSLSFDFANDNGGAAASNSLVALIGGSQIFSLTNFADSGYLHKQFTFQAAGASTSLRFAAYNDQGYVELDNVAVQSVVPEPSSLALMATGLLGCAVLIGVTRSR